MTNTAEMKREQDTISRLVKEIPHWNRCGLYRPIYVRKNNG